MEIIRLRDGEYCLIIDDEVCDLYIAKLLSIEYDLYIGILKTHGACLDDTNGEYWFDTKEQVEILTKELEPYYIFSQTN